VRSETGLDPLDVPVHYENIKYHLRGNKLYAQCLCETQDKLGEIIYSLQGLLPLS
jgi:hypothetical protein